MTEHTPGPWEYWDDNGTLIEYCIDCGEMEAGYFGIPGAGKHGDGEITIYTRADARLIAAAPDLLAALVTYHAAMSRKFFPKAGEGAAAPHEGPAWEIWCKAEVVIKKATRGQP